MSYTYIIYLFFLFVLQNEHNIYTVVCNGYAYVILFQGISKQLCHIKCFVSV